MHPRALALLTALVVTLLATSVGAAQRPFEPGSWQKLLADNAGRPLVVHFWGLTCGPCIVELPEWAKLERASRHARFVYVQADPVPLAGGEATLRRAGLGRSESWTFTQGASDERVRYEVDRRWRGELPKTVLVTADGTITPLRDGTDFTRIRTWLDTQKK